MGAIMEKRELDMLHGPIWNKIPRFALPVAATAILGQLFNAADIAVVGNFAGDLSTAAVAAVGANSSIISLIVNLFIGIALGANVVIARAIGEGDDDAVRKAVHTSIVLSAVGGAAVALLGDLAAAPLLELISVPEDVFPLALVYLRIYLLGMPVILLYNFEAAIFRGIGETKMPLIALTLSGLLNVVLNLLFVVVLGMTVDGVAIATVLSNAVSAALLFRRLCATAQVIRVDPKALRIDSRSLGTVAMAASSAAYNIEIITYDILNSFSQACATFVGQNFGAGKIRRCKRTLLLCLAEGVVVLVAAIGVILFFGKPLLAIFNRDPQVVDTGYIRLMTVMTAHIFSLFYDVMSGYLRGFGISLPPALLTMLGVCGIRLSWIRWVFPHSRTFQTIMLGFPISLASTALLIFLALLFCHPARRFAAMEREE